MLDIHTYVIDASTFSFDNTLTRNFFHRDYLHHVNDVHTDAEDHVHDAENN